MRFFEVLDFQHLVLAVFLGLVAALVMYMSFRVNRDSRKDESLASPHAGEPEAPGRLTEGKKPIPIVLIFLYAGFVVWCILYVIYVGLRGGAL